jgi:hypothetical protein
MNDIIVPSCLLSAINSVVYRAVTHMIASSISAIITLILLFDYIDWWRMRNSCVTLFSLFPFYLYCHVSRVS